MKLNENVALLGNNVILVPYEAKHVEKYHQWMKNEELQMLTGSQPLTADEEYEMQRKWRTDPDKCTFIVLDKSIYKRSKNEIDAMVGDVNLFSLAGEDGDNQRLFDIAECEIMIAEGEARRKGFGREAMLIMMSFAVQHLRPRKFVAKIKIVNTISQQMFEKLDFTKVSESLIFEEATYELPADKMRHSAPFEECSYHEFHKRF